MIEKFLIKLETKNKKAEVGMKCIPSIGTDDVVVEIGGNCKLSSHISALINDFFVNEQLVPDVDWRWSGKNKIRMSFAYRYKMFHTVILNMRKQCVRVESVDSLGRVMR